MRTLLFVDVISYYSFVFWRGGATFPIFFLLVRVFWDLCYWAQIFLKWHHCSSKSCNIKINSLCISIRFWKAQVLSFHVSFCTCHSIVKEKTRAASAVKLLLRSFDRSCSHSAVILGRIQISNCFLGRTGYRKSVSISISLTMFTSKKWVTKLW